MTPIDVTSWRERIQQAQEEGFHFFDFLTAIDRENSATDFDIEVVTRLTSPDFGDSVTFTTLLTGSHPSIPSVADIYLGAGWYERETAEMFGVTFVGNEGDSLLRHENIGAPPLRKSVVLATRVVTEWPGAAEPEIRSDGRKVGNPSRRRQRPPGVPDGWLQS
jgi:NADH-quinone oxidoreductase subunit C